MTRAILAALLLSAPSPAAAEVPRELVCESVSILAEYYLLDRYRGVPLETALEEESSGLELIVLDAYATPDLASEEARTEAYGVFKQHWFDRCMDGDVLP